MSGPPLTAGLFGKLPATGDFVARGLAPDVLAWLDPWISRYLAPRFAVSTTPLVFRFAYPPGPLAGLATASRDRAGRAFPLVLAVPASPEPGDPWFARLLLLATEAPGLAADALAARLAALPEPGSPDPDPAPLRLWTPNHAPCAADPAAPGAVLDALLAEAPC